MWQDYAIGAVQIVFALSLIPSLLKRQYPPPSTCFLTSAGLAILGGIMLTLNAPFSTIVNGITAGLWLSMATAKRK